MVKNVKYKGIIRDLIVKSRDTGDKYIYLKLELDSNSDLNYLRDLTDSYIEVEMRSYE